MNIKKHFIYFSLILSILFTAALSFSIVPVANAAEMTISQLVELLITLGVIAPEKSTAAREAAAQLSAKKTTPDDVTATSTAYIQILTQTGSENWERDLDLPYTITWGSQGLEAVNIAFVTGKDLCNLYPNLISSRNGDHSFKVLAKTVSCYNLTTGTSTYLADGSYKIRIYGKDSLGNDISADSKGSVKIVPVPIPSLKVTYPNGGENLLRKESYTVKYSTTNFDDSIDDLIYLDLIDITGNSVMNTHRLLRSDGTYSFDFKSSIPAGAYKIRLTTTTKDKVPLEDTSDNFFWLSTGL